MGSLPRRIFLSHRSSDKDLVRDYKRTLEFLGLQPWLDEEAVAAGENLERAILQGMKDSCAAVFFLTPSYKDEKYLKAEIEYAVAEKRKRDQGFAIVTLVLSDDSGNPIAVPDLLEPYVWKTPTSPLQGIREIIRALPQHIGVPRFIAPETTALDLRVSLTLGEAFQLGVAAHRVEVLMIRAENHDTRPVYLSGGVSFETDARKKTWFIARDIGGIPLTKKALAPGEAYQVTVPTSDLQEQLARIERFFFTDEIQRRYFSNETDTRTLMQEIVGEGGS